MRGRKPGSPKVHDLSEGRLRVVDGGGGDDGEPPAADADAPPAWMENEDAIAEWWRVLPDLKHRKQYIDLFASELARYCDAYGLYIQARRKLAEGEMLVKRGTGGLAASPYLAIMNREHEKMVKLAGELGLNPVAQVRMAGLQLDIFDQPAQGTGTDGPATPFDKYRRQ